MRRLVRGRYLLHRIARAYARCFLEYAQKLKDLGADSIAIKDMAGMLTPFRTERLVKASMRDRLPVHVHCHYVGGMAP